jgi:hypothetical protein|nr:MAG TPA: hypothetical protein [Caudoviricetes sp.]
MKLFKSKSKRENILNLIREFFNSEECNTTCLHYRQGTCPCKIMKDIHGEIIHVVV